MGSKTSTTTQNNSPYAPAQPMINQGLRDSTKLYNQGGFQVDPYAGDMVAGFDPMRQNAYDMTQGQVGQNLAGINAGQDALMGAMDPSVPDAVRQNVIASIMPGVNGSFAKSGMTGGSLHAQNLTKGLSAGMADVEDQYQRRAMTAAGMMPGMGAAANSQLSYMGGVGADRQQYDQSLINADMLRDQQSQTAEMDAIRNYLALSTGAGSTFGVQQSTSTQPGMGPLGVLGAGLQMAPFLMSDRRVKENIRRVGTMDNGTPIYTYKYKGGSTYHMGVMADEVQNPDAVTTLDNGLQAVNYGEL